MLLGEHKHSLDTKGRIAIPAKFRKDIKGGAIITKGIDKCLFVFDMKEWNKFIEKMVSISIAKSNSRAFARLMLAGATDVKLDSQGRVLIPDYLREYAGLKEKVVVAGLYSRIEIWDVERWDKYKKETENASEEIAEHLSDLGI